MSLFLLGLSARHAAGALDSALRMIIHPRVRQRTAALAGRMKMRSHRLPGLV